MENNKVLDPTQIPLVAMDAMNEVHREELEIVNHLSSAIAENNTVNITELCTQWLAHTKAHFERENNLMETHSFPAFHCHHGEHVGALQGLEEVIAAWQATAEIESLSHYVREVWPKWYVQHIATMDTVTSAFIKSCL